MQAFDDHPAQRTAAVAAQRRGTLGEHHLEQAVTLQSFKAGHAVSGQEQLEHLLEQARRGGFAEQAGQPRQRLGAGIVDLEAEFGGQAHRTQHAHRVFLVPLLGVADEFHQARLHVLEAAGVIAHREVLDRVVERVAGEVAADRIVFDGAVDVVADQHAVFHLAVTAAIVDVGAEGGHFDDLATKHDMGQAEPAADQAAVAEQRLDLLGRGIGGHVEVLGVAADQQVAHGASHQVAGEPGITQPVQHAQGVGADVLAGDGVLVTRNHAQAER
ncbi:hypothetical protein D3C71_1070870 [compost metagenome]